MHRLSRCVACTSLNWKVSEVRNGYELAVCSDCGLLFTVNPDYSQERYLATYEGKPTEAALPEEYSHVYAGPQLRLELEGRAFFCPPPRLTPAERLALRWVKDRLSPKAVVAECGCGTGRFLRALKNIQLSGVGVELSAVTVQLLNRAGLKSIQGAAPDFPWESPEPFAIAFFEVLEHLAEPRQVIEPLKKRFPRAAIIGSVPCPTGTSAGNKSPADSPPHHYLLWTPTALERFFGQLGYARITVQVPEPPGYEQMATCGMFLSRFKRFRSRPSSGTAPTVAQSDSSIPHPGSGPLAATLKIWLLWAYHLWIDVVGAPRARRAARKGFSASSMFFVAEP
jgi:SAM-dependent methyltransferase